MASPQIENGHIDIANELADAMARLQLSGNQWRVLWVVIRQTYGWHKKTEQISLGVFEKKTGLQRRHVNRCLHELAERKIINGSKNGYNGITTYGLQKDYSEWMMYPKLGTPDESVPKIGTKSVPKIGTHKRKERNIGGDVVTSPPSNKTKKVHPHVFEKITSIPEPFNLTEDERQYAITKGYIGSLDDMAEAFAIHFRKNGKKWKDWRSAWQGWVRNEKAWHPDKFSKISVCVLEVPSD